MRAFAIGLLCWALMLGSAPAQHAWTGPDPSRRPDRIGQGDLDFALSELCFPFILQNASAESVANRRSITPMRNRPEWADGPAFYVGQADVVVALEGDASSRSCTIRLEDGVPERYREALDRRMAQWPTALAVGRHQGPANDYARRELFCSPPEGPHDWMLVSTGRSALGARTPAMMITLSRSEARNARCDGAAPPDAPTANAPPAATDPASAELRAFSLTAFCRHALVEPGTFEAALARLNPVEGPSSPNFRRGWLIPSAGGLALLLKDDECQVLVIDADPLVLRQTLNERLAQMPGAARGNPNGMPLENWAAIDLWCVHDEHGLFGIVVSTAAARADNRPDGVLRFARLAPDNQRCPAARD